MTNAADSTQAGYLIASGSYSINGIQFYYDPLSSKDKGKSVRLPTAKIETFTATVIQSWDPTEGSDLQVFRWNIMPPEFYELLERYWLEVKATPDMTHTLTYLNRNPEETWNIHIEDLTGVEVQDTWRKVKFSFRLISQVV